MAAHRNDIARIKEAVETNEDYNEDYAKDDLKVVYSRMAFDTFKLYAGPVLLLTVSLGTIIASNQIMRRRNAELATALATMSAAYNKYRQNVIEEFGEDTDYRMKNSIKRIEVEETVVDEKGKEKVVKKTVDVMDENALNYSPYAKFFDESSCEWQKGRPDQNLFFLKSQEEYFNQRLRVKKFVFLNEIYEALDIPQTSLGQRVGWLYEANDDEDRDNFINFGIFDACVANRRFVNGYEDKILLDFNVDGDIIDKI